MATKHKVIRLINYTNQRTNRPAPKLVRQLDEWHWDTDDLKRILFAPTKSCSTGAEIVNLFG